RLERLAAMLAEIAFQARGQSLDTLSVTLAARCGRTPELARRAAERATIAPGAAREVLARWPLADLQRDARERLGSSYDDARFHDAVVEQGPVPLPLVRSIVLRRIGVADPGTASDTPSGGENR